VTNRYARTRVKSSGPRSPRGHEHRGLARSGRLTGDGESEERLQDAIAALKRQGAGELVRAVFSLADGVAEAATQASQRMRGDLPALEIPVSASGWTGEIEGTGSSSSRRGSVSLSPGGPRRPHAGCHEAIPQPEDFGDFWSRFEPLIGILQAEKNGLVAGCAEGVRFRSRRGTEAPREPTLSPDRNAGACGEPVLDSDSRATWGRAAGERHDAS